MEIVEENEKEYEITVQIHEITREEVDESIQKIEEGKTIEKEEILFELIQYPADEEWGFIWELFKNHKIFREYRKNGKIIVKYLLQEGRKNTMQHLVKTR